MVMRELAALLHQARLLSSFGPDFSDQPTILAWYGALKHIPFETLVASVRALQGDTNFPTPKEIIGHANKLHSKDAMLPEVAFDLLWRKIGSVGSLNKPELPNEIGLAVERLGGWVFICNNWTDAKKNWHEKSFREAYMNITEAKAKGLLSQKSKYAPAALKGDEPKQIPGKVQEALRMAVTASEPTKPKLKMFLKELKSNRKK